VNTPRCVFLAVAVSLVGCGGLKGGNVQVRVRNRANRPVTLWVNLPAKELAGTLTWQSLGLISPHDDKEFDLPLDKLGPGKNIRLQPGAGPVRMTEVSPATLDGHSSITLIMKENEIMEVEKPE